MTHSLPLGERAALVRAALHNLEVQRYQTELNLAANPGATDAELAEERKTLKRLTRAKAALEKRYRAELAHAPPGKRPRA
jgi:hypothetical protein